MRKDKQGVKQAMNEIKQRLRENKQGEDLMVPDAFLKPLTGKVNEVLS